MGYCSFCIWDRDSIFVLMFPTSLEYCIQRILIKRLMELNKLNICCFIKNCNWKHYLLLLFADFCNQSSTQWSNNIDLTLNEGMENRHGFYISPTRLLFLFQSSLFCIWFLLLCQNFRVGERIIYEVTFGVYAHNGHSTHCGFVTWIVMVRV